MLGDEEVEVEVASVMRYGASTRAVVPIGAGKGEGAPAHAIEQRGDDDAVPP